ncbi:MAG: hypothetical protein MI919_28010, partial [Holophagales bacterium]|nr:hypothetical protein [Holophagales bacterium]
REPIQLVDLLPTIIREIGLVHGQELRFDEKIEGEPAGEVHRPILAEHYTDPRLGDDAFHGYRAGIWQEGRKLVALSDGTYRVFREPHLEEPIPIPEAWRAWVEQRAAELLERWRLLEPKAKARQEDLELDPEVEAGLEALGYL